MHVVPKACDDMMQVGRLQNFDGNLNAQGKLIYQVPFYFSFFVKGQLSFCSLWKVFFLTLFHEKLV